MISNQEEVRFVINSKYFGCTVSISTVVQQSTQSTGLCGCINAAIKVPSYSKLQIDKNVCSICDKLNENFCAQKMNQTKNRKRCSEQSPYVILLDHLMFIWWTNFSNIFLYLPVAFVVEIEVIHVAAYFRVLLVFFFSGFGKFWIYQIPSIFNHEVTPLKIFCCDDSSAFAFDINHLQNVRYILWDHQFSVPETSGTIREIKQQPTLSPSSDFLKTASFKSSSCFFCKTTALSCLFGGKCQFKMHQKKEQEGLSYLD